MNINRTFSLPVATAMKLKGERNQSRTVTKAVTKYLDDRDDFSIADMPLRQILAALSNRNDCPDGIKALIQVELTKKTAPLKPPFRKFA